ncbi:hypothetical protein X474_21555 [Dethiosulfatarculus sandiegensis]|uniref:Uncharacterized protein n=1 Tax=Dethiosulfatarculus sandiegensis TaxID=1429043 RepID=A0A0D2J107_9BACT|nr:hypothetical protein X474_21555 [Dethiosulfatarculus sandiegensis]
MLQGPGHITIILKILCNSEVVMRRSGNKINIREQRKELQFADKVLLDFVNWLELLILERLAIRRAIHGPQSGC